MNKKIGEAVLQMKEENKTIMRIKCEQKLLNQMSRHDPWTGFRSLPYEL